VSRRGSLEAVTSAGTTLLTVTAVHFGFQATVTALVYPSLARIPTEHWASAHQAHSRAITPLVALVYGALAIAGGWALLSDPDLWTLMAVAAITVTFLVTAIAAAPAHGRLGSRHDTQQVRHLLQIDRIRTAAAAIALTAAAVAVR
jgi:hypothetical protein